MSVMAKETITHLQGSTIDSFLAISAVTLAGTERLSALNAAALREALIDGPAVVQALARMHSTSDTPGIASELTAPMIVKTLAYTRNVHKIATQTQEELARLMSVQFLALDLKALSEPWQGVFSTYCKAAQKMVPELRR